MRRVPKAAQLGFTALEICTVLCVTGVALAVFVPTFARHFHASKVSEAALTLAALHRRSAAYFDLGRAGQRDEHDANKERANKGSSPARTANLPSSGNAVSSATTLSARGRCLPKAAGPTPATPSEPARPINFFHRRAKGHRTWQALDFNPATPLRYRYSFLPAKHGCALKAGNTPLLRLLAEGDLNGDGTLSKFERFSTVRKGGTLQPVGILYVEDRVE